MKIISILNIDSTKIKPDFKCPKCEHPFIDNIKQLSLFKSKGEIEINKTIKCPTCKNSIKIICKIIKTINYRIKLLNKKKLHEYTVTKKLLKEIIEAAKEEIQVNQTIQKYETNKDHINNDDTYEALFHESFYDDFIGLEYPLGNVCHFLFGGEYEYENETYSWISNKFNSTEWSLFFWKEYEDKLSKINKDVLNLLDAQSIAVNIYPFINAPC